MQMEQVVVVVMLLFKCFEMELQLLIIIVSMMAEKSCFTNIKYVIAYKLLLHD